MTKEPIKELPKGQEIPIIEMRDAINALIRERNESREMAGIFGPLTQDERESLLLELAELQKYRSMDHTKGINSIARVLARLIRTSPVKGFPDYNERRWESIFGCSIIVDPSKKPGEWELVPQPNEKRGGGCIQGHKEAVNGCLDCFRLPLPQPQEEEEDFVFPVPPEECSHSITTGNGLKKLCYLCKTPLPPQGERKELESEHDHDPCRRRGGAEAEGEGYPDCPCKCHKEESLSWCENGQHIVIPKFPCACPPEEKNNKETLNAISEDKKKHDQAIMDEVQGNSMHAKREEKRHADNCCGHCVFKFSDKPGNGRLMPCDGRCIDPKEEKHSGRTCTWTGLGGCPDPNHLSQKEEVIEELINLKGSLYFGKREQVDRIIRKVEALDTRTDD